MEKTIKQIQVESEIVKAKIKLILEDFMKDNPSVNLTGKYGVTKTFTDDIRNEPLLMSSKVDLTLNIIIDEKYN